MARFEVGLQRAYKADAATRLLGTIDPAHDDLEVAFRPATAVLHVAAVQPYCRRRPDRAAVPKRRVRRRVGRLLELGVQSGAGPQRPPTNGGGRAASAHRQQQLEKSRARRVRPLGGELVLHIDQLGGDPSFEAVDRHRPGCAAVSIARAALQPRDSQSDIAVQRLELGCMVVLDRTAGATVGAMALRLGVGSELDLDDRALQVGQQRLGFSQAQAQCSSLQGSVPPDLSDRDGLIAAFAFQPDRELHRISQGSPSSGEATPSARTAIRPRHHTVSRHLKRSPALPSQNAVRTRGPLVPRPDRRGPAHRVQRARQGGSEAAADNSSRHGGPGVGVRILS
jgi:hypothetical protein